MEEFKVHGVSFNRLDTYKDYEAFRTHMTAAGIFKERTDREDVLRYVYNKGTGKDAPKEQAKTAAPITPAMQDKKTEAGE